jgi:hypothetical protein
VYQSPGFSGFRSLLDQWDDVLFWEDASDRIASLLDNGGMILFFTRTGDIFGAPEESRVVFARMKKPDDDTPDDFLDQASFMGLDLFKALTGERSHVAFGKKDLKNIKVIDRDECEKKLVKKLKSKDAEPGGLIRRLFAQSIVLDPRPDAEVPGGMTQIKDKK